MTTRPAPGLSIAQLPGLAVLDQARLVVLSCEDEVAAHYTAHFPVAGQSSLAQPYQATAVADAQNDAASNAAHSVSRPAASASDAVDTLPGGYDEASAAISLDADPGTAGCVTGHPRGQPAARRKRKRKAAKAPNEAESEVCSGRVVARARVDLDTVYPVHAEVSMCCVMRRPPAGMPHSGLRSRPRRQPCSSGSQPAAQWRHLAHYKPPCASTPDMVQWVYHLPDHIRERYQGQRTKSLATQRQRGERAARAGCRRRVTQTAVPRPHRQSWTLRRWVT